MSLVVVLGAGGLLGRHLTEALRVRGHEVRALDRRACDVADAAAVQHAVAGASAVVNCAAYTNVDKAEAEADAAWRANALGAELVGRAAEAHGVRGIHISTDFVFAGDKPTPYDEFDAPQPRSTYARSKLGGEVLFHGAHRRGLVVRVQGLYGHGGGNFASKLPELLRAGKLLTLDAERRVQPTWAGAAAAQLVHLLDSEGGRALSGTVHLSCSGETTWAGFTHRLIERLGLAVTFAEVTTSALAAPAARPPNCLFEHRMLQLHDLFTMPSWQDGQDAFLAGEAGR
jgi:dTDP-4-dehydrorhamnose reductase